MKQISRAILTIFVILSVLAFPSFAQANTEQALFAGGCFWCLEHDLEDLVGVNSVQSGYSGGELINPTYANHDGHKEVVLVSFNSNEIEYDDLLKSYWRNIDPLDGKGQFCDRGDAYKPLIFTSTDNQRDEAIKSVAYVSNELGITKDEIKVQVQNAKKFWLAEEYHQDFAERNSLKYNFYRYSCGRDSRLAEVWGETAKTGAEWTHEKRPNITKR